MNRRGFLRFLGVAPIAAVVPAALSVEPARRMLSIDEEHQLWQKDVVPPRHTDDNDMRHIIEHSRELEEISVSRRKRKRIERHIKAHHSRVELLMERQMMEIHKASGGVGTGNREDLLDIVDA